MSRKPNFQIIKLLFGEENYNNHSHKLFKRENKVFYVKNKQDQVIIFLYNKEKNIIKRSEPVAKSIERFNPSIWGENGSIVFGKDGNLCINITQYIFSENTVFTGKEIRNEYYTTIEHFNTILINEWERVLGNLVKKYMLCGNIFYKDVNLAIMNMVCLLGYY